MTDHQSTEFMYLGREGKTFGPFSLTEIEVMKRNGEFYKYEWMWDGKTPDWSRVPPPAPPPPPPLPSQHRNADTSPTSSVKKTTNTYRALCHDFHRVVAGLATEINNHGCIMICKDTSLAPPFMKGARLWMDLYEEATDRSVTIKVMLTQLDHKDGKWSYHVGWDSCPLL